MKIFSWMRNKFTGKENSDKLNQEPISHHITNEEFSDWPNGLFSIGTFGNNNSIGDSDKTTQAFVEVDNNNLHEDEKKIDENKDTLLQQQTTSLVHIEEKDINKSSNKNKNGIGKKSLSFLLKKALVCSGGLVTGPTLLDPVPDPKPDNSRLEKILRAMLHKKIYPQKPTTNKYLNMPENDSDDDEDEKSSNESKWVKTDSEYIVLEI